MSKPPMTPEDVRAMATASREFHDAVDALTTALRQRKSEAEINEAIRTMEEKKKASVAFTEKFFNNYPQP
jgi:hypothetical protein